MVVRPTNGSTTRGIPREKLLSVAAELFAKQGYRATTLDHVASALSIKKASLYHYMRSKEDLLTGIYDRIFDRIEAEVRPVADESLAIDERLRRMVHAHVSFVCRESAMLAVVFQEEAELSEANRAVIQTRKREYEQIFERVVEEGQEQGVLRKVCARTMVRAVLGMCNWTYQWYSPERHDVDEIASQFSLLIESGWLQVEGDTRMGAWARPGSVKEAIAPAKAAVLRAREQIDQLTAELEKAEDRLEDGLA